MNEPTTITNWKRLSERVTTSGQPAESDLGSLAALGVRTVINLALHTHERALPDEAGSVAALGMAYVHIPVAFNQPTEGRLPRLLPGDGQCQGRASACPLHHELAGFSIFSTATGGTWKGSRSRRPGRTWSRSGSPTRFGPSSFGRVLWLEAVLAASHVLLHGPRYPSATRHDAGWPVPHAAAPSDHGKDFCRCGVGRRGGGRAGVRAPLRCG